MLLMGNMKKKKQEYKPDDRICIFYVADRVHELDHIKDEEFDLLQLHTLLQEQLQLWEDFLLFSANLRHLT